MSSLPPPTTPKAKSEPTTAVTPSAEVQVVTNTVSDDHTLSAKTVVRPMLLDQTFPLKPAVRQQHSSSTEAQDLLSPTGSGGSPSRRTKKRVAFAEDQGEAVAPEGDDKKERASRSGPPIESEDIDFDEVFDAGQPDDMEDATFQLDEDYANDQQDSHEKEAEYYPPTLEEAARMLSDENVADSGSSAQAIGISASSRTPSRDAQNASVLSSSIRVAGSFSQFMRQQGEEHNSQFSGHRLAELTSEREIDPAEPPSPSAEEAVGQPIYEGVSLNAEPLSTSHVGSYNAWSLRGIVEESASRPGRSRPTPSQFRRSSGGAEFGLNHIIGANVPSHRAMWQASRKENSYALSDEDNRRWAQWQRFGSGERSQSSPDVGTTADLSRSVPAGPSIFQPVQRGGLYASTDVSEKPSEKAIPIPTRAPTFQSRRDDVDREAKTSLPYNERLFVPSYMKAIGNMSTSRLGRGIHRQLSTIDDEDGVASSTSQAPIASGLDAQLASVSEEADASTTQVGLERVQDSQTKPGSRVPFLAPQDSEKRREVLRHPYQPPPPPTSSSDRLVPTDEDAPVALPLFEIPAQSYRPSSSDDGAAVANDYADADHQAEGVLKFMHRLEMLKKNKRTGWYHHRVANPESISDHMYRMSILAMLCASDDSGLDVGKCVMLALVHDMAEAEVGDLTPRDNIEKAEKLRREAGAMVYFAYDLLGGSRAGQRIEALWEEYEARETPESKLVKDLDRFELCLQALEYEREFDTYDLQPFFRGAAGEIGHPIIRAWVRKLADERQQMWAERGRVYEQPCDDVRPGSAPAKSDKDSGEQTSTDVPAPVPEPQTVKNDSGAAAAVP
ncbi:unnamed protein product [Tilletia caries]|nr:unnamed protein product [Tilletia caries]